MVLAVELFPLPAFPSKTSLSSVDKEDGFLPEKTKKGNDCSIERKKQTNKEI